jgi:hypothetical protein
MAVMLPLTAEGQREARQLLSVQGHLERDPALLEALLPDEEMLWGLALASLRPGEADTIASLLGTRLPDGALLDARLLWRIVSSRRQTVEQTALLEAVEELARLGFATASEAGLSASPFWGTGLDLEGGESRRVITDTLSAFTDYEGVAEGTQILAAKSGARGSIEQLARMVCTGFVRGIDFAAARRCAEETRDRLWSIVREQESAGRLRRAEWYSEEYGVLARARRGALSDTGIGAGLVFARAAARGEVDPLVDEESRLFVGLRPLGLAREDEGEH